MINGVRFSDKRQLDVKLMGNMESFIASCREVSCQPGTGWKNVEPLEKMIEIVTIVEYRRRQDFTHTFEISYETKSDDEDKLRVALAHHALAFRLGSSFRV
jgi:hypothetical protein